jgi:uncharacterized alpha-E superfamily protein
VRCTEGARSDPLELDPSSFDAPAGLVQAARTNPALIANALGSAIIENRGLGGFLPRLCRELLGEELMLTDPPRRWLGDPKTRAQIESGSEDVVIRLAREGTGRPGSAKLGRTLSQVSGGERAALIDDIGREGASLVAEQRLSFGTMPMLTQHGLRARAFAVRLFVSLTESGFSVMPGGLCMGVDPDAAVSLSASDGETHDVWVISEGPEKPHASIWQPRVQAALVQRSQRALQSRVADNLYWLGRYLERADWTMRVIRTALGRRLEYLGSGPSSRAGDDSLELLLSKGAARREASGNRPAAKLAQLLVSQKDGMYGLAQTFDAIYRVASLTRDRLSLEAWRTLSTFRIDDAWRKRMQDASASEIQDEIEDRIAVIATFGGHMHENMTRNFGWFFLDMGRRLERAYNLCDSLNTHFARAASEDEERERLRHILDLADSYITYRSRYRLEPMLALVLDLLLIDETNPRSVAYQLKAMSGHLEALPQANEGNALTRERRVVLGLQTAIRLAEVHDLGAAGENGQRAALQALLTTALNDLPIVSDAISRRYFRLLDGEMHRVSTRFEPKQ